MVRAWTDPEFKERLLAVSHPCVSYVLCVLDHLCFDSRLLFVRYETLFAGYRARYILSLAYAICFSCALTHNMPALTRMSHGCHRGAQHTFLQTFS